VTAAERRILAVLDTDHPAAVLLLNRRIVKREQRTITGTTDNERD
jgi:hypothetical protein